MQEITFTPNQLHMRRFLFFAFLMLIYLTPACAQTVVSGTVRGADNKEILPFVNIGIRNKNIGAITGEDGKFSLTIPAGHENETLSFSYMGYEELQLPLKQAKEQQVLELKAKTQSLKSVEVKAGKVYPKKYGIYKYAPLFRLLDGSIVQDDIFEIAQLVKLGNKDVRITTLNLHINSQRADSGLFRINFYGYDGSRPTQRLVEKNILLKRPINYGWMQLDLNAYNIYLKGEVVVSVEFIPSPKKTAPISYEVKVGGRSKSFTRKSSLGLWEVPPHHYRMYLTGFATDNKAAEDDDEKATEPVRLYSKNVQDSFSVFIHLPKNYDRSKSYPVVYVLDANVYFDILAGSIEHQQKKIGSGEQILVGIGYRHFFQSDTLRERDYTYPTATPTDSVILSGGADKFLAFIQQELVPYIDGLYTTDTSNRSLMGHSLGGYFVLYALYKDVENGNKQFNKYVAASPSLEYANAYITKAMQNLPVDNHYRQLYITAGARENMDEGVPTGYLDLFKTFTQQLKINKAKVSTELYPKYDHMETAVPSFEKGLGLKGSIFDR
jgi:predicted alpha/beta superfamily hydrolase